MHLLKPPALALLSASLMGCAPQMGGTEKVASSGTSANANANHEELVIAGTLVRKGSEMDAWWALVEDSGNTWRLQLPPGVSNDELFKAQNTRVQLIGTPGERFFSTPMMVVKRMRGLAK